MRMTSKISRAIIAGMIFLTAVDATWPSGTPAPTAWGPMSGGLQCALTMLPTQPGDPYSILFWVKNGSPSNIRYTFGEFTKAAAGLVDVDQAGKTSQPWFHMLGTDPARPLVLTPGQMTAGRYVAAKTVAGQSVSFNGSFATYGASSSIPLRCGPISINPPKT